MTPAPTELDRKLAPYPSLATIVAAVVTAWPEHEKYCATRFASDTPDFLARTDELARLAPLASSTSVKPPVDAPTSSAMRPAGSKPKPSSAAFSLMAPLEAENASSPLTVIAALARTSWAGFIETTPSTATSPRWIRSRARERVGAKLRATNAKSRRPASSAVIGSVYHLPALEFRAYLRTANQPSWSQRRC